MSHIKVNYRQVAMATWRY